MFFQPFYCKVFSFFPYVIMLGHIFNKIIGCKGSFD
jgi:hypothetical protein